MADTESKLHVTNVPKKQMEKHGCIHSIVATDALVLKP